MSQGRTCIPTHAITKTQMKNCCQYTIIVSTVHEFIKLSDFIIPPPIQLMQVVHRRMHIFTAHMMNILAYKLISGIWMVAIFNIKPYQFDSSVQMKTKNSKLLFLHCFCSFSVCWQSQWTIGISCTRIRVAFIWFGPIEWKQRTKASTRTKSGKKDSSISGHWRLIAAHGLHKIEIETLIHIYCTQYET